MRQHWYFVLRLSILVLTTVLVAYGNQSIYNNKRLQASSATELEEIFKFRQQFGVNVGGVFVLERWMNEDFFANISRDAGTSEIAYLTATNDAKLAKASLESRWRNYVSDSSFAKMSKLGINTIRLPVGYWDVAGHFNDTPLLPPFDAWASVYENALLYLHLTFQRAWMFNIGILLDLHGAPGSQNGADHSGVSGPTLFYSSKRNIEVAVNAVRHFVEMFSIYPNMVGIELLNEPRDDPNLGVYYDMAYAAVRAVAPLMPVYICDTTWTSNLPKWRDFILDKKWTMGFLDTHPYYAFSGGSIPADQYPARITNNDKPYFTALAQQVNVIVGEWSNALDGGSYNGFSPEQKRAIRIKIGEAQLDAWQNTGGYTFWTWHSDLGADQDWDLESLIDAGTYKSNFSCWPPHACDSSQRPRLAQLALQSLPSIRAESLASHQAYWLRTAPNGNYDWTQYTAGFDEGYQTAIRFHLELGSKVGYDRELANLRQRQETERRQREGLSIANTWQYHDGVLEAIRRLTNFYRSAPV